jgi:hypothetical protein
LKSGQDGLGVFDRSHPFRYEEVFFDVPSNKVRPKLFPNNETVPQQGG